MTISLFRASRVSRGLLVRHVGTSADPRTRKPLIDLKPDVREKAELLSSSWKGTNASGGNTKNYIGGEFVESKTDKWIDVLDPVSMQPWCRFTCKLTSDRLQSSQTLLTKVPETTSAEFDAAVDAASQAYASWGRTSVLTRQRFVMEYDPVL